MCRRSRTFQRADSRPLTDRLGGLADEAVPRGVGPGAATPRSGRSTRAAGARRPSSRAPHRGCRPAGPGSGERRPAGTRAAPARPRHRPPRRAWCRAPAASPRSPGRWSRPSSTTSTLIGICLAGRAGSRSTSSATPSDTATSSPTVNPFSPSASPIAKATKTPSTTAALRWSAVRSDARTETATDHHGRQRCEHRSGNSRDHPSDPPRQAGRQARTWPPGRSPSRWAASTRLLRPGVARAPVPVCRARGQAASPRPATSADGDGAGGHVTTLAALGGCTPRSRTRPWSGGLASVAECGRGDFPDVGICISRARTGFEFDGERAPVARVRRRRPPRPDQLPEPLPRAHLHQVGADAGPAAGLLLELRAHRRTASVWASA